MVSSALRNPVAASITQDVGDGMWGWGVLDLDAWGMSEEWYGMESELQGGSLILGHRVLERRQELGNLQPDQPQGSLLASACLPLTPALSLSGLWLVPMKILPLFPNS